ncbi:MAG: S8 family peptidase [Acidimicrobiales bacterium]
MSYRHRLSVLLLAVFVAVALVAPAGAQDPTPPAEAAPPAGDERRVVVQVADPADAPEVARSVGAQEPAGEPVRPAEVTELSVPAAGVAALEADPRVTAVLERGRASVTPGLATSVPRVGAPARWAAGFRGAGKVIVVIDTGVAAGFGGDLVGQACFAVSSTQLGTEGHCGPDDDDESAFSQHCFDLGICEPDDVLDAQAARPCHLGGAACDHGTAVAAVAAGDGATPGVAPDAGVYAIRVFEPTGAEADIVDLYLAIAHALELVESGLDVAAVNLSVSAGALFSGTCDTHSPLFGPAFRDLFDALAVHDVATAVAAGNNGSSNALGFPACISSAVSVGSTHTTTDTIAGFSNRSAFLDLLAPGTRTAGSKLSIPGSPSTSWAGTSFSAPHVAGAYALVAQEHPKASLAQRTWLLQAGGVPVQEGDRTYRRLLLRPASEVLPAQVLFPGQAAIAGTARSAVGDFDGDGRADVLAHGPGGSADRVAYGRPDWRFDLRSHTVGGSYLPVAGSFRGAKDGPDDIFWYAPGSAPDFVWAGQGDRTFASSPVSVNGTFEPHVGDFDGDGWDDIFWFAPGSGADYIWYGGTAGFVSRGATSVGPRRAAVGDFNDDGRDDIFLHGPGAATDAVWLGTTTKGSLLRRNLAISGSYLPIVANLTGSSADDLLLYRPGSGADYLWVGGGGVGGGGARAGFGQLGLSIQGTYQPQVGDLDGDSYDEVIWYAPGPAGDSVWFGRPAGGPVSRPITVSGTYSPLVADFDASGGDDIVWFNAAQTTTPVWWSSVEAP